MKGDGLTLPAENQGADPAENQGADPAENGGAGDELDPPRGIHLHQRAAPVNITVVPCHNDMLVMFASPQGDLLLYLSVFI
jgi:hypothetical protein